MVRLDHLPDPMPEDLVVKVLVITERLLLRYRMLGIGPEYIQKDGQIWYPRAGIEAYLNQPTNSKPQLRLVKPDESD